MKHALRSSCEDAEQKEGKEDIIKALSYPDFSYMAV